MKKTLEFIKDLFEGDQITRRNLFENNDIAARESLFEDNGILALKFFGSMYWGNFCGKLSEPQVHTSSFLGVLKELICSKGAYDILGMNAYCYLDSDDDDNELIDKAFFVFSPGKWVPAPEEIAYVDHHDFVKIVEEVLIQYEKLQENRWRKYSHIRELEEEMIAQIRGCLHTNFGSIKGFVV